MQINFRCYSWFFITHTHKYVGLWNLQTRFRLKNISITQILENSYISVRRTNLSVSVFLFSSNIVKDTRTKTVGEKSKKIPVDGIILKNHIVDLTNGRKCINTTTSYLFLLYFECYCKGFPPFFFCDFNCNKGNRSFSHFLLSQIMMMNMPKIIKMRMKVWHQRVFWRMK